MKELISNLSNIQKIILLTLFVIVLAIFVNLLNSDKGNEYTSKINYRNFDINTVLNDYEEKYEDRNSFYDIYNILISLNSNYSENDNRFASQYQILDSNYSKKVSKSKFKNVMYNIFSDLNKNGFQANVQKMKLYESKIYDNIYICCFDIEGNNRYIGIILNKTLNEYNIFYIQ